MAMDRFPRPSGLITLLTDFGERDTYVGQMKAVILSLAPQVRLVDLTHAVPPQDILEGSFQLATAWRACPPGTVHVAVIDPGVGTARRALACLAGEQYFVLPDNGLGTLVFLDVPLRMVVVLDRPQFFRHPVSRTFHGRDIFAPAAAHLASGTDFTLLGTPIAPSELVQLPLNPVARTPERVQGPLLSIDRFGNCRTLIRPEDVPFAHETALVRCRDVVIHGIHTTYSDVEPGSPLALFGSHGGLEIAIRNGNAAHELGLDRGDLVEITSS
jgi:S-adenosylmethionine hydrolase